ncbi:hypothetical protein NKJ36_23540 [Mesorhizobium sp. M0142]|uniref:hypothetical protein n=1 Tax=Mesorhizobium sp. M0142 TaxID=2956894 RepID=UPI00333C0E79
MEQDALILKAQDRIRYHEAEAKRWRDFVATAEALIADEKPASLARAEPRPFREVSAFDLHYATQSSATGEILKEAQAILEDRKAPMPAAEIYEMLVRRGIKIAGKSPKGNLTAKFSTRRDIFTFDNTNGHWSLTEWGTKNETPPEQSEGVSEFTGEQASSPIETQTR